MEEYVPNRRLLDGNFDPLNKDLLAERKPKAIKDDAEKFEDLLNRLSALEQPCCDNKSHQAA